MRPLQLQNFSPVLFQRRRLKDTTPTLNTKWAATLWIE
jgi:hypothetical protein